MKKIVASLLLILSFSSQAGTYQGSLKVDRVWVGANNIVFDFTTKPADCVDLAGYFGGHASIPVTNPLYKEQLSLLLTAKASGKKIDIWYTDTGDCKSPIDILNVNTIGISAGQ